MNYRYVASANSTSTATLSQTSHTLLPLGFHVAFYSPFMAKPYMLNLFMSTVTET